MSPVMIAALLIGLRVKKETIGEITAAAQVMREFATRCVADRTGTWSTSSAPAATARTPSTSPPARCSSPPPAARAWPSTATAACRPSRAAPTCWRRWAKPSTLKPRAGGLHRRHRHRLHVRAQPPSGDEERRAGARELGVRTIFNILGPLTNPAGAPNHPDGRVPPRPGRHPGARAAAPGRRARAGGLRHEDGMDEVSLARRRWWAS